MKNLSTTCLMIWVLCIAGSQAFAASEDRDKSLDDFDFQFEHLDVPYNDEDGNEDESEAEELRNIEKEVTTERTLEPEAEMLPVHYKGVKPPGVDHMEMKRIEKDKLSDASDLDGQKVLPHQRQARADHSRTLNSQNYRFFRY